MTTLLNSFAIAQRGAFVSGFEYGEMQEYLAHLVNRSANNRVQIGQQHSSRLQEVIFIDPDKVVDEHGKPCTSENVYQVLKNIQLDHVTAISFENARTGIISFYTDIKGDQLTVVAATDYIKNEAKRARTVSITAAGYLHYLLNAYSAYMTLPLDELAVRRMQLAYNAVKEQTGEKFPIVFEEIIAGMPKTKVRLLLQSISIVPPVAQMFANNAGLEQPGDTSGAYIGGGYGYMPVENPHLSDALKQSNLLLADFVAGNPNAILLLSDTDYDVKLTMKHQPTFINRDHFSNVYNPEMNKQLIIYIKYNCALDITKLANNNKVRFVPGKFSDVCHFGTFHVDGKQYAVRTVTPEHTGFMEDLYNMADTNAELVYIGLHLMYLLQENVVMGKIHQTRQLYLAFNAIEQLTGKPFHEQEWLLKHLGDKRFDAVKLRHQCNFVI